MSHSTVVTFPSGSLVESARVVGVHPAEGGAVVVLDRTPFHPVDHTWPDQPGDRGALRVDDVEVAVTEAVMAAVSDEGEVAVGADIPVKRGAEGWTWLVGHRVEAVPSALAAGASAEATVDAVRLSLIHI